LIRRITESNCMSWVAQQLGMSERTLMLISLGRLAANPTTIERLRVLHGRGPVQSGAPMKYRSSQKRW
jgi:hypothetical protein